MAESPTKKAKKEHQPETLVTAASIWDGLRVAAEGKEQALIGALDEDGDLGWLANLEKLWHLRASNNAFLGSLDGLKKCVELHTLDLSSNHISGLEASLPNLRNLYLDFNSLLELGVYTPSGISNQGAATVRSPVWSFPQLQVLTMQGNNIQGRPSSSSPLPYTHPDPRYP